MTDLEICIDSVESAVVAEAGGAQRVELCSALSEGGLTPSLGMIRAVRSKINIGVFVIIRPRGGDFLYSDAEFGVMQDDIRTAAAMGANGVVLGILTSTGDVDVERTRQLVELAYPMQVTFHRAFDMARDLDQAMADIIAAGAHRILTSGAAQNAVLGAPRIEQLVAAAGERIRIMVGGSVRANNLRQIAEETGAQDYHAALRTAVPSPVRYQNASLHLGDPTVNEYVRYELRLEDVLSLRQAIDSVVQVKTTLSA